MEKQLNISVAGTGYVGLSMSRCLPQISMKDNCMKNCSVEID